MTVDRDYLIPQLDRGMDHELYEWSPLDGQRARLEWPGGARVALCAIVCLGHMEWRRPEGAYQVANIAGGYGPGPFPNVTAWSHREYGHRVGVFRVLDVLERHGIRPTVAIDALTAEHYPFLVRHCVERGCEIIAHGVSANRMITSRMSEDDERAYIRDSVEAVARRTGNAPAGWIGPDYGESTNTPRLLAEAGVRYVCDWANDDQPYRLHVPRGTLHALPVALPLDDINALWDRRMDIENYGTTLRDTFDTLHREGAANGRLMVLPLHPFLIGQPFRIGFLNEALAYIAAAGGVWAATGSAIIEHSASVTAPPHPAPAS